MYDNMFEQFGISTNSFDELLTAAATNDVEKAKKAIENGVDLNYIPRDKSILFVAIENKAEEIIDMLLENGANPNTYNRIGWTPLHEAILQNNESLVNKLISYNASVYKLDYDEVSPLFLMIKNNNLDMLENLLHKQPLYIEATNKNGDDLLAQSIKIKNLEAISLINKFNPNLEHRNNEMLTVKDLAQNFPEALTILNIKEKQNNFEESKTTQQNEAEELKKELSKENILGISKIAKKKRTI